MELLVVDIVAIIFIIKFACVYPLPNNKSTPEFISTIKANCLKQLSFESISSVRMLLA